jgi:hypothetical protein
MKITSDGYPDPTPGGFASGLIGAIMGACLRPIARKRSDFVMLINAAIRFFCLVLLLDQLQLMPELAHG